MNIAIWGCGYFGTKLNLMLDKWGNNCDYKVMCFVDNNVNKIGKIYMGVPVIAPSDLCSKEEVDGVIIAVSNEKIEEIVRQANKLGISNIYIA